MTKRRVIDSTETPHKGHETLHISIFTPCLNIFSLDGNLSCKSCQEKTTILEGEQLIELRRMVGFSTKKREEKEEEWLRSN